MFGDCIQKPTSAIVPEPYQEFLMRDVLHLSTEEIDNMDIETYFHALNYCWTTYMLRRSDLPYQNQGGSSSVSTPFGVTKKPFVNAQYSHIDIDKWVKEQQMPKHIKKGEKKVE